MQQPQAHLCSQGGLTEFKLPQDRMHYQCLRGPRMHYQCLRVVRVQATADRRRTAISHPKPFAVTSFALQ